MTVKVRISPLMRVHAGGARQVSAEGSTVSEVFVNLFKQHSEFERYVLDDGGKVHRYINVCVDDVSIKNDARGLKVPVKDGQTISILSAVAGG